MRIFFHIYNLLITSFLSLQGGYPARLKKVLIVTAPLWFKAPFKILRLFVREKLRERVFTVSVPTLSLHVPRKALPTHLGGSLVIDHATWLLHCHKSMKNREDELLAIIGQPAHNNSNNSNSTDNNAATITINNHITIATATKVAPETTTNIFDSVANNEPNENNITINGIATTVTGTGIGAVVTTPTNNTNGSIVVAGKVSNGDSAATTTTLVLNGVCSTATTTTGTNLNEFWSENPPSSASSGFSDDDSLAGAEGDPKTIEQIVQMVKERGRNGLIKEYGEIRNRAPEGTFVHAR